ncbi:OmpA family protein [Hymenobacter sp. GOD-10R]|uniref:OmpA family protein n=1 Tax=Hymenobacter sp. GOD-10R TaxID=3093922 RepID=UPI002D76992A|nr:OmpA family protein [Hymenobacter sp. GOD-10R]WRQ31740.1 OmpA family protein [Hymenobacter sp. GOD-10R]
MILTQSLLEEVQSFVLRNELMQIGSIAEEPAFKAQNALSRVVPLVVQSLLGLSERVSGQEVVWSMAHDAAKSEVLSNPHKVLYANKSISDRGAKLVNWLLGNRYEASLQEIVVTTGIRPESLSDLVNIVVPVTLGVLGEQLAEHHWSAKALSQWLHSQQPQPVSGRGLPTLVTPTDRAPSRGRPTAIASRWLWVALVVAACLIGYLLGYQPTTEQAPVYPPSASAPTAAVPDGPWDANNPAALLANGSYSKANGSYIYDRAGVPVVLKLKGGVRQIIGANSTENKLYQVLVTPASGIAPGARNEWITFDRIYFESNKAVLTAESMWQLLNVASILLTFPSAKVQLGGYTDSTGSVLVNNRLSTARARAAKATLVKFGVDSTQLEAKGYGSRYNIASNTTEDGRALNRRVSIQVMN